MAFYIFNLELIKIKIFQNIVLFWERNISISIVHFDRFVLAIFVQIMLVCFGNIFFLFNHFYNLGVRAMFKHTKNSLLSNTYAGSKLNIPQKECFVGEKKWNKLKINIGILSKPGDIIT